MSQTENSTRAEAQSGDLRTVCQAVLDDYQTSDTHHPDHVLIRRTDFERIKVLVEAPVIARAEAQNEGAAGEASAYRVRMISNDPAEWVLMHPEKALDFLSRKGWESQPLYAHPSPTPTRASAQNEGAAGEREAMEAVMASVDPATWPGLSTTHRAALGRFAKPQAHPSPTPAAADADRVRIAVEALEPFAALWDQISEDDRVRRAWRVNVSVTSDAVRKAIKALAVLKSTTAKERGE